MSSSHADLRRLRGRLGYDRSFASPCATAPLELAWTSLAFIRAVLCFSPAIIATVEQWGLLLTDNERFFFLIFCEEREGDLDRDVIVLCGCYWASFSFWIMGWLIFLLGICLRLQGRVLLEIHLSAGR